MKILALDFGGSSVKYGVIDENATLLTSGKRPAPLNSANEFLDTAEKLCHEFKGAIEGIGISLPGNIDPDSGVLLGSGVYDEILHGCSITEMVHDRCGLPAAVENDGKCGALSEAWKGSLADVDDGIVMILGSGIAGGLIKDHRVHSGKGFNAGEFSYTVCRPGDYSMMSCATMAVGALGITYKLCKIKNLDLSVQDAAPTLLFLDTVLGKYFPAMDGEPGKTVADGKQFFAWVKEGDRDALRVYQDFITALGAMVFNAQICYAPDRIVIGGGLSMGETVLTDLKAELAKYDAGFGMNGLMSAEVVRSTYLGEANLYGAAYHYIGRCVNQ